MGFGAWCQHEWAVCKLALKATHDHFSRTVVVAVLSVFFGAAATGATGNLWLAGGIVLLTLAGGALVALRSASYALYLQQKQEIDALKNAKTLHAKYSEPIARCREAIAVIRDRHDTPMALHKSLVIQQTHAVGLIKSALCAGGSRR